MRQATAVRDRGSPFSVAQLSLHPTFSETQDLGTTSEERRCLSSCRSVGCEGEAAQLTNGKVRRVCEPVSQEYLAETRKG